MVKPARRYDIYLPLADNQGQRFPREKFIDAEQRLVGRFGGLTTQQREFPLKGMWEAETQVYVDEVIIMTALDFRPRGSTRFIVQLKKSLLLEFQQLEILITESSLRVH
jgi:hypothetical protein